MESRGLIQVIVIILQKHAYVCFRAKATVIFYLVHTTNYNRYTYYRKATYVITKGHALLHANDCLNALNTSLFKQFVRLVSLNFLRLVFCQIEWRFLVQIVLKAFWRLNIR